MKEEIAHLKGAVISEVQIMTEDAMPDECQYKGLHMGYSIKIVTDKGAVFIEGCHDGGPWVRK